MATTTNYGWTTPDDTALVKDGASAIRTLGSSVDTTTKNLNPETTLGDIAYRSSTANVNTRLGLGTAGQVLTVNSGANAPEWATASSGGMTLISTTSLTGTSVTLSSIPQIYNNLYVLIQNFFSNTANRKMVIKPNNTASLANYTYNAYTGATDNDGFNGGDLTTLRVSESTSVLRTQMVLNIHDYTDTTHGKVFEFFGSQADSSTSFNIAGTFGTASAISSLVFSLNSTGSFNGGQVLLYGVK